VRRTPCSRKGPCSRFESGSSRPTSIVGSSSAPSNWARETKAFDPKKLPKTLRVAMDSSPLDGAGRVEDTINLLAHAGRKIVACAAMLLGWTEERVCLEAGVPTLPRRSQESV
jgi:hypothetical protein